MVLKHTCKVPGRAEPKAKEKFCFSNRFFFLCWIKEEWFEDYKVKSLQSVKQLHCNQRGNNLCQSRAAWFWRRQAQIDIFDDSLVWIPIEIKVRLKRSSHKVSQEVEALLADKKKRKTFCFMFLKAEQRTSVKISSSVSFESSLFLQSAVQLQKVSLKITPRKFWFPLLSDRKTSVTQQNPDRRVRRHHSLPHRHHGYC